MTVPQNAPMSPKIPGEKEHRYEFARHRKDPKDSTAERS